MLRELRSVDEEVEEGVGALVEGCRRARRAMRMIHIGTRCEPILCPIMQRDKNPFVTLTDGA